MKDWFKNKVSEVTESVKSVEIGDKTIGDYTKPMEDFIDDNLDKRNEDKKEQKITVYVKKAFSKNKQPLVIRKDIKDLYYLSNKYDPDAIRYNFERISWGGSTFTQTTHTEGEIKTKGRMGSAMIGAGLAGTPGAMIGASRGRKSKVNTKSTTTSQEHGSEAIIFLRNIETDKIEEIKTQVNSAGFSNLQQFFI